MSAEKLIHKIVSQENSVSSKSHNYYKNFISLIKRIYVLFWHNLSLDPRVRASPYDPPPENEVKLKPLSIIYYRSIRITLLIWHIISVITIIYGIRGQIKIPTIILGVICLYFSALGTLTGTHRYWSHHSFKATLPLELFLLFCHSVSAQYSAFHWARQHRVHHKFSDTIADPHNASAGLFFSHIGYLLYRRTPECQKAMEEVWVDDLKKNKILMFQHKYWPVIIPFISLVLPSTIPWYFWNESLSISIAAAVTRLIIWVHLINTVNSYAHFRGMKPFDQNILPTDSWFAWFTTFGDEGWHNYHHAFPKDYKASEFWGYKGGLCTAFIELCAKLGLAYDLKTTSIDLATKRRKRTGDLSCPLENWDYITTHAKNL